MHTMPSPTPLGNNVNSIIIERQKYHIIESNIKGHVLETARCALENWL